MKKSNEFEEFFPTGSQYIIGDSVDEFPLDFDPWATLPKWDIDTACKAITLSRMVDIENSRKIAKLDVRDNYYECPAKARRICDVYDRARFLAENAIKDGTLNERDTPANWIKWAEENRYDTGHLKFILDPEAMDDFKKRIDEFVHIDVPDFVSDNDVLIEQNNSTTEYPWVKAASSIAKAIYLKNKRLNNDQIATKTYEVMLEKNALGESGMTGRGNRVPRAGSIKRRALKELKT